MQNSNPRHSQDADTELPHSEYLETLGAELETAIDAISKNHLQAFEDSVQRQELLVANIARFAGKGPERRSGISAQYDRRRQVSALFMANRTYADLLEQLRSSTQLLNLFCRSYRDSVACDSTSGKSSRCSLEV